MSGSNLTLKPITDLLQEKFFIPSYQRGYRWTSRQVTDLLDDISTFQRENDKSGMEAFYCLQPIVVMKRAEGDWELIDGQQRLTTLFLILTFLKPLLDILNKTRYKLHYETREGSGTFLEHIDLTKSKENIDYYHICRAYQTIEKWFEGKDGNHKLSLLQCLLNGDDVGKNVKVIWYELPSRENPVDVFIRLNMGKIPLTNAELIRALFLRQRNFNSANVNLKQLQIAQEWDGIEKVLQSEDFWYFIHKGDSTYATRIEYIFWLITQEQPVQGIMHDDPYYTFIAYNLVFRKTDVDTEWRKVKQYFMTCEEWFRDRTLYHLVGYMITEGEPLLEIRQASNNCGKRKFQMVLKDKIFKKIIGSEIMDIKNRDELKSKLREHLGDLSYEGQSGKIRSVLLLFNIATLLQNKASNLRFPFDSYKKENWDIEHIRSVKSDKPARVDAQKLWLKNVLEYWTGGSNRDIEKVEDEVQRALCYEMIGLLKAEPFDKNAFDEMYDNILDCFSESAASDVDHGLANLALLDARTNRSYKNAVFPIKRRRILSLDKDGTFVPLCTTNVFLKYYSCKIDDMMFWGKHDREDYFNAVVDTLVDFFVPVLEEIE